MLPSLPQRIFSFFVSQKNCLTIPMSKWCSQPSEMARSREKNQGYNWTSFLVNASGGETIKARFNLRENACTDLSLETWLRKFRNTWVKNVRKARRWKLDSVKVGHQLTRVKVSFTYVLKSYVCSPNEARNVSFHNYVLVSDYKLYE